MDSTDSQLDVPAYLCAGGCKRAGLGPLDPWPALAIPRQLMAGLLLLMPAGGKAAQGPGRLPTQQRPGGTAALSLPPPYLLGL